MKDSSDKILREYVSCILSEDSADMGAAGIGAGDVAAAAGPGGGGGGGGAGDPKGLYSTFISPFTDVVKTAIGKSKEAARRGWTVVNVALNTVLSTLIPGIGANYKAVFENEKKDLEKIRSKYKDVYERTNKALTSTDATVFAFLADPQAALAAFTAAKSPVIAKEALSAITGGISDEVLEARLGDRFPNLGDKIERFLHDYEVSAERKAKLKKDWYEPAEKFLVLYEEDKRKDDDLYKAVEEILKSPEFLNDVMKDSRVKNKIEVIQKDFSSINRETLEKIYSDASKVLGNSSSLEDLEKLTGKSSELDDIKKLSGDERKKAEEEIMKNSRAAIKNFYVKMMKDKISDLVKKEGIPKDSQYVQDYIAVMNKIEKL